MRLIDAIKHVKDCLDPGSTVGKGGYGGQIVVDANALRELFEDWGAMDAILRAHVAAAPVPWGAAPSAPAPLPQIDPSPAPAPWQPKKVELPTRLSCERGDPAYGKHDSSLYEVYINGVYERDVVTADSAAGYYRAYVRDGKGDFLVCGGEVEIRDYFAKVEIRRKYDQI